MEDRQGRPVGSIDTHDCDPRNGTFSYGVAVAPEHRRKGYAVEAIEMVLRYYFEELRYQKATVRVHSDNPESIALHRKLGFQQEGVLRRMVFTRGGFVDEVCFGQTAEEFRQRNEPRMR